MRTKSRYRIHYESKATRCAWCWETISDQDSHTVIEPISSPRIELRFHHNCWPTYLHLSGVELRNRGTHREWTPEMVERLRISLGLTTVEFSNRLEISHDRYIRIMRGDEAAFSDSIEKSVKHWAIAVKFDIRNAVDWSDDRAFFCLRMNMGVSARELARRIGVAEASARQWDYFGSSQRAVRSWARLDEIARQIGFDGGMIVDHRLWTKEAFRKAFTESGRSVRDWSRMSGLSSGAIKNWLREETSWTISRDSAWRLTRAATVFGLELPQVGSVRQVLDRREHYRQWYGKPGNKEKVRQRTKEWRQRTEQATALEGKSC